jgi:hypothetical protein
MDDSLTIASNKRKGGFEREKNKRKGGQQMLK